MLRIIALCCLILLNLTAADHIDKDATVRSFGINQNADGAYQYQFETTNGISQQEVGAGGYYAQGTASHYAPDGQLIQLNYLADETGFHPQGDHLPTPPPIPDYILKALEYIRTHSKS